MNECGDPIEDDPIEDDPFGGNRQGCFCLSDIEIGDFEDVLFLDVRFQIVIGNFALGGGYILWFQINPDMNSVIWLLLGHENYRLDGRRKTYQ